MAFSTLHPARGLLHPAWLVSLAVLALNDHVLKGSGLLPAPLTGKLSDVAGLLVAPLLLAVVLRVRSWRGWVASHVAVGVVFSAIQLSATCADGWSALMGMIGFPWVITRDATDLYTLPALALGLWGLAPALRRVPSTSARRSAELGVASVGLLCCAATSDPDPCCDEPPGEWEATETSDFEEPPPGELPSFDADVYLHNATAQSQVVRLRALRPEVVLDCATVAAAPGGLLRSELFAPASSWTLPANANLAVLEHTEGEQPCYAAWVEGDALTPAVLFWIDGLPRLANVPGEGQVGSTGEIVMVPNGLDGVRLEPVSERLVFAAEAIEPAPEGECAAQPDGTRVGWSSPVPFGLARLEAVDVGPDGCFALDLVQGELPVQTWYLCVPETSFPFVVGDELELRVPEGADPLLVDAVELVARDEQGEPALPSLLASAGTTLPVAAGIELAAVPLFDCDVASEPRCGTVERPMALLAGGVDFEAFELRPGDAPERLGGDGRAVEITLMHAQERFVLDPMCGLGPDALGPDLEVVIAQWPRGI